MARVRFVAAISGLAAALAFAGVASAAPPTTLASSQVGGAPTLLVDSHGTVSALWTATESGGLPTVRYAREPAGAKHFTQVVLPNMPSTQGSPFIYEPARGVLEVIVTTNGTFDLDAWTSTNDGASWTNVPTTPLEKWMADGLFMQANAFYPAAGGPLDYAGSDGETGPIVQLNPGLNHATTVGTDINGIIVRGLGRSADGTLFVLGAPADASGAPGTLPFQAGTTTGNVTFPCSGTAAVAQTTYGMAIGRSLAVVAFAGCGHVWTRTVTAGGVVGPVVSIGSGPGANASGTGTNGTAWLALVAAGDGTFTLAYTVPGSDIGVSHSSDGSHWTAGKGLVAAQGAEPVYGTAGRSLSRGQATWYGASPQKANQQYRIQVMPLSDTYRPPAAPSGHGIASPRKGKLGSLAATAPGKISKKSFEKTAKVTAKVVDALGGKVTAAISIFFVKGMTTTDVCSGSVAARLSPGKAKSLTIPCASGAIVIGGSGGTGTPIVKKGYQATFNFTGRNGTITLSSKIG